MASVAKYQIMETRVFESNEVQYTVWEPGDLQGSHYSVRFHEGEVLGRIGSRIVPDEILDMPAGSSKRIIASDLHFTMQFEKAYDLILAAHPNLESTILHRNMGIIIAREG
jgi:hypothetical protein